MVDFGDEMVDFGDEEDIDPVSEELETGDTGTGQEVSTDYLTSMYKNMRKQTLPGTMINVAREAPPLYGLIDDKYHDLQNMEEQYRILQRQKESAIAPLQEQYTKTAEEMAQIKEPPPIDWSNVTPQERWGQMNTAASKVGNALGLLIAFSPLLVSRNGAVAMNMLGMSLQAYMQGRNELGKQAHEEYKTNAEIAIQKQHYVLQQYKDTYEKYKDNMNALRLAIQEKAKEFKDPQTFVAAQISHDKSDLVHLFNQWEVQDRSAKNLEETIRYHNGRLAMVPYEIDNIKSEIAKRGEKTGTTEGAKADKEVDRINKEIRAIQEKERAMGGRTVPGEKGKAVPNVGFDEAYYNELETQKAQLFDERAKLVGKGGGGGGGGKAGAATKAKYDETRITKEGKKIGHKPGTDKNDPKNWEYTD